MPRFEKLPALPKGLSFARERRAGAPRPRGAAGAGGASDMPPPEPKRRPYPSDLTDAQWALLKPLLPPQPPGPGRPREVDLREVVNAVLYVLRTGCPWEFLPHDLPPAGTVYYYFQQWRSQEVMSRINDFLRGRAREQGGRAATPSAGAMDSQSVKTTETPGERGYDGGKRLTGRKRHGLFDTLGHLIRVLVSGADWHDAVGGRRLLGLAAAGIQTLKRLWIDRKYTELGLPDWAQRTLGIVLEHVATPIDQVGFVVVPRRWVAERSWAWGNRNRRLSKDYEGDTESSAAWWYWASIRLLLRRLAPPHQRVYGRWLDAPTG